MTIDQAIATLKAAGIADAHFHCGRVNFTVKGKLCGIGTDYRAEVKAGDVAFWVGRAK